ncbi:MAG: hypothetical protein AVDCRST_MAG33-209 [uncultured Thermomicrobiales bacterium]|uniref:ABM domain-containing protein n=1 Tax=uncultured Thermomicrobiales bacterium TaxID=1645740 RepID=A0A6J4UAK1_9BACT|nr:MAG: hypothetical protein AVDCRST_MAG33-209 [uncultured Thermomicrobiales bacterium]
MDTGALVVRLEAGLGQEQAVADFLRGGLEIVQGERGTTTWFALQLGPSTFGIFDTFAGNLGRQAHLSGQVATALMAQAPDFFSQVPSIERADILALKMP